MKINTALVCLNLECEEVFESRSACCPACGGRGVPLSKWLNPSPENMVEANANRVMAIHFPEVKN